MCDPLGVAGSSSAHQVPDPQAKRARINPPLPSGGVVAVSTGHVPKPGAPAVLTKPVIAVAATVPVAPNIPAPRAHPALAKAQHAVPAKSPAPPMPVSAAGAPPATVVQVSASAKAPSNAAMPVPKALVNAPAHAGTGAPVPAPVGAQVATVSSVNVPLPAAPPVTAKSSPSNANPVALAVNPAVDAAHVASELVPAGTLDGGHGDADMQQVLIALLLTFWFTCLFSFEHFAK